MRALVASSSVNWMATSPPPTTAGAEPLIDGKSKNSAFSPTVELPSAAMLPATKSPS